MVVLVNCYYIFRNNNPTTSEKNLEEKINTNTIIEPISEIYTITGEELGEYGKKIILNANTDMPVSKYLYKLPSGTYDIKTTDKKYATFWLVKDQIIKNSDNDYPEELEYVNEQYMLTSGEDDFNGKAKKNIQIEIHSDESILIIGNSTLICEKIF